jgi:hypothetical protein
VGAGILRELFENNIHQGCKAARIQPVSNWVNVTILAFYVKFSPHCKRTSTSFSPAAFEDLWGLFTLAIPIQKKVRRHGH